MFSSCRVKRSLIALTLALLLVISSISTVFASPGVAAGLVGPKKHYLALGDSLAFGYQPDLDYAHGYTSYFSDDLKSHGMQTTVNMACPGETSVTMLDGHCPYPILRKFPYLGSQLNAALTYLTLFRGQVSPVTLDIGANDVLPFLDKDTCAIDTAGFNDALETLDTNLQTVILPKLQAALTVNGTLTGDLVLLNYYDPYQNSCPASLAFTQTLNQHLAADIAGFGTLVDIFSAFGGATTPNANSCTYTWICSLFKDIHARDRGYQVMAQAIETTVGY